MTQDTSGVSSAARSEWNPEKERSTSDHLKMVRDQFREALLTSRTGEPPRLDAITAIDKLQTLDQLFSHDPTSRMIERLIQTIQNADAIQLAKPAIIDQLLQQIISPPAQTRSQPIQAAAQSGNIQMARKKPKSPDSTSRETIGKRIKAFLQWVLG
ncbi:hypothetical protein EBR96_02070 [bacterium]|nr:hypothetical protein [bacterium]